MNTIMKNISEKQKNIDFILVFAHCPSQAFVFEWTRSKGLFISKVSEKNFKRGSGEEYTWESFIEYVKRLSATLNQEK